MLKEKSDLGGSNCCKSSQTKEGQFAVSVVRLRRVKFLQEQSELACSENRPTVLKGHEQGQIMTRIVAN